MNAHVDLRQHYREVSYRLRGRAAQDRAIIEFRKGATIYDEPIGPVLPIWKPRDILSIASDAGEFSTISAFAVQSLARSIVEQCCTKYNISRVDLFSTRRKAEYVIARHEAMYRLRNETSWSFPKIGRYLGGRDWTTVIYGCRRHAERNGLPS